MPSLARVTATCGPGARVVLSRAMRRLAIVLGMSVLSMSVVAACASGGDGSTATTGGRGDIADVTAASGPGSTATSSPDPATGASTDPTAATTPASAAPASSGATATTAPAPGTPMGFDRVAATAVAADGTVCELCLWLAEMPEDRARGLMNVTDLGAADGMAFVYPEPSTRSFWMKDTLLPLSIAFFDATGAHLGELDMEPCAAEPCPSYPTAPDFVVAVEVEQGRLAELGIGPGSTLELLDGRPCPD